MCVPYIRMCDCTALSSYRPDQFPEGGAGAAPAGERHHPPDQPEERRGQIKKPNNDSSSALWVLYCSLHFLFVQVTLQDSQVELETYKQTRQGLDEMYNVVWKQYKEEKRIRQVRDTKIRPVYCN